MPELNITCPECGTEVEIAEQLAAPLVEAEREKIAKQATVKAEKAYAAELAASTHAIAERDAKLEAAEQAELAARKAKEQAEEAKRQVELTVKRQVEAERQQIAEAAAAKAVEDANAKLALLENEKTQFEAKLNTAQEAELAARKAKFEAEEAKREVEITVARQLDTERTKVREAALTEAAASNRLKMAEKNKLVEDLMKQVDELKRKGEIGSQQLQGDVMELDITDTLQRRFPDDRFERVGKGQRGADVIHTVIGPGGMSCGAILWELKRTKAWNNDWLGKLRTDQREKGASLAALVSETLPDDLTQFDCRNAIWISDIDSFEPMATALRVGLIETGMARQAMTGANSKKELVYNYLTGIEFRQKVGGLVEVYRELRDGLDAEKRAFSKQWKAREKQIGRLLQSTAGMYGELQGIIGANLPEVEGLGLTQLEQPEVRSLLQVAGTGDEAAPYDVDEADTDQ